MQHVRSSASRIVAVAAAVGFIWLAGAPAAHATDTTCDVFASPSGSDTNAGTTVGSPVKTIHKLLQIVPTGTSDSARGVACVRAGTYDFSSALEETMNKPWTSLRPYNGEAATLIGRLQVAVEAHHAIIENLTLNGWRPNNPSNPSLMIFGDNTIVRNNKITNDNTEICVHVAAYYGDRPQNVVIQGNEIYNCGYWEHANHDHGIYVAEADGTQILDNNIHDNQDRGIQLWPDSDGSLIEGNVVDYNGEGISIGSAGSGSTSDNNIIRYNVITRSNANFEDPDGSGPVQDNMHGWNLEFPWASSGSTIYAGSGNQVYKNCFEATHPVSYYNTNAGVDLIEFPNASPLGFTIRDNTVVTFDPYVDHVGYVIDYAPCTESGLASSRNTIPGPYCSAGAVSSTYTGTSGSDTYGGTAGTDYIQGLGGTDQLSGSGSNDCVDGGNAADAVTGGQGSDELRGGAANDTLNARAGDDSNSPQEWDYALDCGSGTADVAYVDITDSATTGCESVRYDDP